MAGSGLGMSQAWRCPPLSRAPSRRSSENVSFPCSGGVAPQLLDGGGTTNMGLEPLADLDDVCLVAVNAGGLFATGAYGGVPVIRDLKRAQGLLYRQTTALRMRSMVERFKAHEDARAKGEEPPPWARLGVRSASPRPWMRGRVARGTPGPRRVARGDGAAPDRVLELQRRTMPEGDDRTWWLTGAVLSRYHRELLPAELPKRKTRALREAAPGWASFVAGREVTCLRKPRRHR